MRQRLAPPEMRAEQYLADLAVMVERVWAEEVRARGIDDPFPLAIRWSMIVPPSGWRVERREGYARGDELAAMMRTVPSGQLAIVGKPGTGKTVAAILLTLSLCRARDDVDRVPVLLAAGSWDPGVESLTDFVTRHLVERYGMPPAVARHLVVIGQILPILDGLDEQHDPARALRSVHEYGVHGWPIVVTCRRREYEEAVARSGPVPGFVVVALLPLRREDVADYLARTVPSSDRRWTPLIDTIQTGTRGPLATVLSRPTYLQVLRTIYSRADSAPSELLDTARFPTAGAIEAHLLDSFILSSYATDDRIHESPGSIRWLEWLATWLQGRQSPDITLPDLAKAAPAWLNGIAAAFVALVVGWLAVPAPGTWLAGTLFIAVMLTGLSAGEPAPFRVIGPGLRLAAFMPRPLWTGVAAAGAATGVGLVFGGSATWPSVVAVGLGVAVMTALKAATGIPVDDRRATSPRAVSRGDASYTALAALLCTAVGAFAAADTGSWSAIAAVALAGAFVGVTGTGTYRLFLSRLWLAGRGHAPFRLLRFLDDAYRRGVLRQAGGAYQFRNLTLQQYLADRGEVVDVVRAPGQTPAGTAITHLRAVLVERAFEQTSVRQLVEADRVGRLRDEIGAELRNSNEIVAAAATAQWDRLADARARYTAQVGVPRLARVSAAYGWAAGAVAAFAVATMVRRAWNQYDPSVLVGFVGLIIVGSVTLSHLETARRDLLARIAAHEAEQEAEPDEAEAREWVRRRRLGRLLRVPIFPPGWSRWIPVAARCLLVLIVAGVTASLATTPLVASAIPGDDDTYQLMAPRIAGAVAVVLGVLWWWSRPWFRRLQGLRSVDMHRWPPADETPWAAASRRLAVRAWEEWAATVVDLGVLPLVSAKVEPLTRRSYDTALPPISVDRLGDITEGVQFVSTDESDRLSRMLASTLTAAIGISGPRGVGKTTLLRRFGDQRIGSSADNLMLVVPAPTNYNGRDFLVHLFARLCLAVLPPGDATTEPGHARRRIRHWWPWVSGAAGVAVVATAYWWSTASELPSWLREHTRPVAMVAGGLLVLVPLAHAGFRLIRRRRRPQDTSVVDLARQHLRRLRYLETLTVTRGTTLKAPPTIDLTGSMARARAEHVRTYPQLVGDFRDFLGLVALHLRSRPGRSYSRVVICIDELDKISSAEQAEQFLNDIKAVFGVDGCVFLVAVSEDALSSFARRALSARTTFDTAFDDVLTLRRFGLADTRRLLVQRVLRLPEPYVWLCHCLSGGLPRDLNRTVRLLYDVYAHRGPTEFAELATELVRQDLESVAYGQALRLTDRADQATAELARWLIGARRLTLDAATVREYAATAPKHDAGTGPDVVLSTEQFTAYLEYLAAVLDRFCEHTTETIGRLRAHDDDVTHPALWLAEARAALSTDPFTARAAVEEFVRTASPPPI
ncbi:hypothetical protein ACGFJ7_21690 [Actinoplanes sp. NPDC048988]|uniref:hypothetical protein n=1 Tax=Actinoplanes sp. NPDC048988 TaxID=3363901 RepID=UPI0037211410